MSQTPSKACCNTPPVVSKGYEPKGKYITVDGLKTYVTGPANAKRGILFVYDVFGFFEQTLQGADILAYSDKDQQYQVFMPDFLQGDYAQVSWFTNNEGEKLGAYFSGPAAPPKTVERISKVMQELKNNNQSIEKWGGIGLCWGNKTINLSAQTGTPFSAVAGAHPAMVDAKDAEKITVPILLIPSEGESKEDVEAFEKALKVKHQIEWFSDQIHGFMGARADLSVEKNKSAYEKGYQFLLNFFHEHLS